MAESTLSLGYDEIQIEVGRSIGYSADSATWSAAEIAEVDRFIQAGYRQFLYPPAVEGIEDGYEWSFIKPTVTITTIPRYETGDVDVVAGTATISGGGTWPTWAYTHGTLVLDGDEYTIVSRDSDVELTVVGADISVEEDDWYLKHAGYQDLPDDFGRIIGDIHFEADVCPVSIPIVSEYQLQMHLQQSIDESRPQIAATRFKAIVATSGQRQEIMWWPIPSEAWELTYRYEAFTGKLETGNYPLGGMKYSEVIVESCMAVAEQRADDDKSLHWDAFIRLLKSAIAQDSKNGARYYGPMGRGEGLGNTSGLRRFNGSSYDITYKGSTW